MIFFDPVIICRATDGGSKGLLNEALLFHEALHGKTGIQDSSLESAFDQSTNPGITYYIENNVFGSYSTYLHDGGQDTETMQCQ